MVSDAGRFLAPLGWSPELGSGEYIPPSARGTIFRVIRWTMADLYTNDLVNVKLDDLRRFLCLDRSKNERPRESQTLDFKKDIPPHLGDDVAAMANTYGGLILLGIETDAHDKNVPSAIVGAELGPDPRARLTDKVAASVHPRPEFDIQPLKLENCERLAAIIRIREGVFPPYEYSQGATARQPVRVQDTTRQASVPELESLFAKRGAIGKTASELTSPLLRARDFAPTIEDEKTGAKQNDPFYNMIVVVPRGRMRVTLDSRFERSFERLIMDVFRPDPFFS